MTSFLPVVSFLRRSSIADRIPCKHTVLLVLLTAASHLAYAQVSRAEALPVLTPLLQFSTPRPTSELTLGSDGNFYGTTNSGGANGSGMIYRVGTDGTLTELYSFRDGPLYPSALILGSDGNFYGTTGYGGDNAAGSVFRLSPDGVLTTLHSFMYSSQDTDQGYIPGSALVQGSDGNFYGTTTEGGFSSSGTIFRITPGGTLTTLHKFGQNIYSDAAEPHAALIQARDGNFYGTTSAGGNNFFGTVYRMTPAGVVTLVYQFGGDGGITPDSALVQGTDGNFYGTAKQGGGNGNGSVYKVTPDGTFTLLHAFSAVVDTGSNYGSNADGAGPTSTLVQGSDGAFYGTANGGGVHARGTVFKITSGGVLTTLYDFPKTAGSPGGSRSSLLLKSDGAFYGTSTDTGANGDGSVYRIAPAGTVSTVYSFNTINGIVPSGAPVQSRDGNFYGATIFGGVHNQGTFYRVTPDGGLTTLYSFGSASTNGVNTDGFAPGVSLIEGSDGFFYGETLQGGTHGSGTIFRVSSAGDLATIYTFQGAADGQHLGVSSLVEGKDGAFYGTLRTGGADQVGTIFRVTTAGVLTTLYNFAPLDGSGKNADGAWPGGGLILGTDGFFYGTANLGGSLGGGTAYRITAAGALTTLHTFSGGADGRNPTGGLLQASDGLFYGAASAGGINGSGVLFRMTSAGDVSTLYAFSADEDAYGNNDGAFPVTTLVQGGDGNFYGSTQGGGIDDEGVLFQVTPSGGSGVVTYGEIGAGGLVRARDGNLYGTLTSGEGIFFLLTVVAPSINSHLNITGTVGQPFSYQITAAGSPTSFQATGLPQGLTLDASTGIISGTPAKAGAYSVNIQAGNSVGTSKRTLSLIIRPPAPVITSSLNPPSRQEVAFAYQITATNAPASYGANGLPAGLSVNQSTGRISGTPTVAGTFTVTIQASNSGGVDSAKLTLLVKQAPPVITSELDPPSRQGVAFGYQITATNDPTGYGVGGLPAGLSINQSTGRISGTPTVAGTFAVTIKATNSGGSGTATVTLVVKQAPPVITSSLNPPSRQGVAFSYQITATNDPTGYGASGFPAGISINQSTGRISGTPTVAGTFTVTIKATNSGGSALVRVTLVVKEASPVITSSLNPPSRQDVAFSYQITATNHPASFGVSGLPAGLTINQTTGKITGKPTKAGTYKLTLKATNSGGSGLATLTLVVKPTV